MNFSDWHFKRAFVAESYFKTIFSGVILSTTIFAEKQTGLTNFFINDLMPCAIKNKHSVAYVDLSNKNISITAAVLMALDRVLLAGNSNNVNFGFLRNLFISSSALKSKEFYMNSADSIDESFFEKNAALHFELIREKIKSILAKNKLLLIFDHSHELLKDKISYDFCVFYKELLGNHRDELKPIYGTCDMDAWSAVFKSIQSPLYSEGASVHKLPPLGMLFVRELKARAVMECTFEELQHCFSLLNHRPGILMALILGWNKKSQPNFVEYVYGAVDEMRVKREKAAANHKVKHEVHY